MSTGSLGQGLSVAVGMSLGLRQIKQPARVYVLVGDGEIQEGQIWEACMAASHYNLDNLCVIIDNNNLQIDGSVVDVMNPYPIKEKLEAFGFFVQQIDGHDFDAIEDAFNKARCTKGKPSAILLKTVKGKGISFMENIVGWHSKAPNDAEYTQALQELTNQIAKLEA